MKKVVCDNCGFDVTYTSNSINYKISLKNERIPSWSESGAVTDMMIYPKLPKDYDFCSLGCLKKIVSELK
jgi:hypothetical protein